MSAYRKIDRRMWADANFSALPAPQPSARYLWVYLLTGPHTGPIPGLSVIGEAGLAEALEWPLKAFREAFEEARNKLHIEADWKARLIWIPNAIKYNPPESPNVVKFWSKSWDEIPECPLKLKAYEQIKAFLEAKREGCIEEFNSGFAKPSIKRCGNQEHEQEQEHKHTENLNTDSLARSRRTDSVPPPENHPPQNSPPVLEFETTGPPPRRPWPLLQSQIDRWSQDFPGVDVLAECRKARAWLEANPGRRKTFSGMQRMLVAWLARAQNDSRQNIFTGAKDVRPNSPNSTAGNSTPRPFNRPGEHDESPRPLRNLLDGAAPSNPGPAAPKPAALG